jgi:hypothetical protein
MVESLGTLAEYRDEEAVQIISDGKGKHFDPDVVDAFLGINAVFRIIALTYADHEEERKILLEGMSCSDALMMNLSGFEKLGIRGREELKFNKKAQS